MVKRVSIAEIDKNRCTGCKACSSVCNVDAIAFGFDADGFWYPVVDDQRCVKCGLCYKKCPALAAPKEQQLLAVYAAKSCDDEIRLASTSGGLFSEFAKTFLDGCGYVSGAVYTEKWTAKHILTNVREELKYLRKSKYMQSDMGGIYSEIHDKLHDNKVLFCGTPCQVAAVHYFLGDNTKNLYTIDFICRGVFSPGVYREYLDELEREYGSKIANVWVKNKELGWHSLGIRIDFENGQTYMKPALEDKFGERYLIRNTCIRPSCFDCSFKGKHRMSDITIGDFWGLNDSELDDNLGTSVVIVNSAKGEEMFDSVKDRCLYKKMTIEDVVRGNPCYEQSVERKD